MDILPAEYTSEEEALSILLKEQIIFASESGPSVVLYVLCNDLFYWASADGEALPYDQILILYNSWKLDNKWGAVKWLCSRRHLRPQVPVIEEMKKDGVWDSFLEALPSPAPS